MRPLSSNVRTALIFFLAYAGIVLSVTLWLPSTQPTITRNDGKGLKPTAAKSIDLGREQKKFQDLWRHALIRAGYSPEKLYKFQEEKLLSRRRGPVAISWIFSRGLIVLPAATSLEPLIKLGSSWKELSEGQNYSLSSVKWTYSRGYLGLKLKTTAKLSIEGRKENLPIAEMTLMEPVAKFKEKFSGLPPVLPPELIPALKPKQPLNSTAEPPLIKEPEKPMGVTSPLKRMTRVAIIIDDVGYVSQPADEMLKVPAPLTWAILPDAPYTKKYRELAKAHGFEILLHLPLEPLDSNENPGPGVIKRGWTEEEVGDQLNQDLAEVPEAVGINNHMGSAGTSDDRLMEILMKEVKQRRLFFVDSMTTPGSVAEKYARLNQIPFAKRKIFIDNDQNLNSKKAALRKLIKIALRDGPAIGIAHVRQGTAEAIMEMLPEFAKAGVEIVPVSELVK
ncbi:MAG: divergent polysaccharide deacetylase family protein [Bacillota bacterium]